MSYPENTIWYVEASDGGGYTTCGSAVAIRLRKLDEPRSAATYLISCAHVLRGRAQDGSAGFGRLLPTVHAWPPDFAYHQDYGKKVRIDASIKPLLPPGDVPLAKRTDVADDWVVLKFEDDSDYSHTDAVREWVAHDSEGQNYRIFGFPGGKSAFSDDNIVSPTKIPDYFQVRNDSNGVLTSQGDQTRPGTSGGGVFEANDNAFAGIHQSRINSTIQVRAVSAKKIRDKLYELGYEPSTSPPITNHTSAPTRKQPMERQNPLAAPLTPRERLNLSRNLNAISDQQFGDLLLLLEPRPPAGVIPPDTAPRANRVTALLTWAESLTGCKLPAIQQALSDVIA